METITEEMSRAGVVPAGAELELMKTVRQLLEHRDRLQKIVATEGEVIVTRKGVVKVHPALTAHLKVSATIPKVLSGIVIGDSTATANHRQRKAALVRWDRDAQRREAQARVFEGRDGGPDVG